MRQPQTELNNIEQREWHATKMLVEAGNGAVRQASCGEGNVV